MYFMCGKVLDFLKQTGTVFTVRRHRYHVGKDWITDKRGHKKIADVMIKEVGPLYDTDSLTGQYLENSGFNSQEEWIAEIHKLHKSDTFRGFYLYRVDLYGKSKKRKTA